MACSTNIPPVLNSECDNVALNGGLEAIYIQRADQAAFTDWTQVTEWSALLDDSGVTGSEIRTLYVQGDLPLPAINELTISRDRKFYPNSEFTLNLDVDDLSDENYAFISACVIGLNCKAWWKDKAGYLYGGNSGIFGTLQMSHVIPRDDTNTFQIGQSTFRWKARVLPERVISPI